LRLLLDTHVWIWSLISPERIGRRAFSALGSDESECFLSPVSVWELLVLIEKGRVEIDGEAQGWTREALERGPFREATLNHEVALESRRIKLPHDDPADRPLVPHAARRSAAATSVITARTGRPLSHRSCRGAF